MRKKILKLSLTFIFVLIFGGLGGVLADRYIFPYLSSTEVFGRFGFLRKSLEDVTIINKTEQVFVKEDSSISKISNQVTSSVVNILSYPKNGASQIRAGAGELYGKNKTGLIITSDGLIMTYQEKLDAFELAYKVMTFDGKTYDAEMIGADSYSNLAFLKIVAANLPTASFADSDDVNPGEKIIAIGNDFQGYSNRFASGLLSEFDPTYNLAGKTVSVSEKMEGVFGIDINYDKAFVGGPVVDYQGQIIGVIGSVSKAEGQDFFLIPANKINNVVKKAINKTLSRNPMLGVYYLPITRTYAVARGISEEKGVQVFSASGENGLAVIAGSPAQKAGLRVGDIILSINDQEINQTQTLSDILYRFSKGDSIELSVSRNNEAIRIQVQL